MTERFAKPIKVPNGRLIRTVTDARLYLAALQKSKRLRPEWQAVAQMLKMAVEGRVSLKFCSNLRGSGGQRREARQPNPPASLMARIGSTRSSTTATAFALIGTATASA